MERFTSEHVAISQRSRGLRHHEGSTDVRLVTVGANFPRDLDLEVGAQSHGDVHSLRLLQLREQDVQRGLVLRAQPGIVAMFM